MPSTDSDKKLLEALHEIVAAGPTPAEKPSADWPAFFLLVMLAIEIAAVLLVFDEYVHHPLVTTVVTLVPILLGSGVAYFDIARAWLMRAAASWLPFVVIPGFVLVAFVIMQYSVQFRLNPGSAIAVDDTVFRQPLTRNGIARIPIRGLRSHAVYVRDAISERNLLKTAVDTTTVGISELLASVFSPTPYDLRLLGTVSLKRHPDATFVAIRGNLPWLFVTRARDLQWRDTLYSNGKREVEIPLKRGFLESDVRAPEGRWEFRVRVHDTLNACPDTVSVRRDTLMEVEVPERCE